ncbi:MAG: HesA/MoeB/ThiF family protein [Rhizomicrobium sp.]
MYEFTDARIERYSRHILLENFGRQGQEKLWAARILVIGLGGLGSPAALYLAAAGVGTLGLADADTVELSNLQRQIIHTTPDLGRPKVESAADKVAALNPDVRVKLYPAFLNASNIMPILADYDFVIDGTDSFVSKFLINDACVLAGKAFSHGGILRYQGQTMTVVPGRSPCYRCLFDGPPPADSVFTCANTGVLGAIAGMLGTIQAAEALKYVTGTGDLLTDGLLTFDAMKMRFRTVPLQHNPQCPVCGDHPTITALADPVQPACPLS